MNNVLIAAPIHNRSDFLPYYFMSLVSEHLFNSDINCDYYFVMNNCNWKTWTIVIKFKEMFDKFFNISLKSYNETVSIDGRESSDFETKVNTLIACRNLILESMREKQEYDYLFSVDTDIRVIPGVLGELIRHDKDIVSGLVYNDTPYVQHRSLDKQVYPYRKMNILNFSDKDNYEFANHYMDFPLDDVFRVDVTGAVYLLKRKVTEEVDYSFDAQGEDVAFCREALKKGFEVWADSSLLCDHFMELE